MPKRGFTLVELLVVLAVIAVLAFAVTPSINDWLRNARLRNQAESIQAGIQQARNEAVRLNTNVTLWLVNLPTPGVIDNSCALSDGSNTNGWVISMDNPAGQCAAAKSLTAAPRVMAKAASPGAATVSVSSSNAGTEDPANSITFNGLGRVVTSATTPARNMNRVNVALIDEGENDRPLQLDIDASGAVRRCDLSVSNQSDPRACPSAEQTGDTPSNDETAGG